MTNIRLTTADGDHLIAWGGVVGFGKTLGLRNAAIIPSGGLPLAPKREPILYVHLPLCPGGVLLEAIPCAGDHELE